MLKKLDFLIKVWIVEREKERVIHSHKGGKEVFTLRKEGTRESFLNI